MVNFFVTFMLSVCLFGTFWKFGEFGEFGEKMVNFIIKGNQYTLRYLMY